MRRVVLFLAVAIAVMNGASAAAPILQRDLLPPDLPLDAEGMPTRCLDDEELHRLLLAVSEQIEAAPLLLAACHASGRGYGTPGWGGCVEGSRPVGSSLDTTSRAKLGPL